MFAYAARARRLQNNGFDLGNIGVDLMRSVASYFIIGTIHSISCERDGISFERDAISCEC